MYQGEYMKKQKIQSNILFVLGIVLAVLAVCVAFAAKDTAPRIVQSPTAALKRVESMMDAIRAGDYDRASEVMYGCPSMGEVPTGDNLAVELIWTEFLNSIEYNISGDCYVSDTSVVVDVSVKTLNVPQVISGMEEYAEKYLSRRIAAADDLADIYDSEDNIHQEVMNKILWDAALQSLENNREYQEQTIAVNLVFEKGEWWILPDEALQSILSGSFNR